MEYVIKRGPFILLETVELLFKYVNGVSFRGQLSQRSEPAGGEEHSGIQRKLECLQEIMDRVCAQVDREDPLLQYYFGATDGDNIMEKLCLARFLTDSFFSLKDAGLEESLEAIGRAWKDLQAEGGWIRGYNYAGLNFSWGTEPPGELIDQICALSLPAEFQLKLFRALNRFDRTLDEFKALLGPIAEKLEEELAGATWILEEMEQYWKDPPVDPVEFLANAMGPETVAGSGERTVVAISLLDYNTALYTPSSVMTKSNQDNYLYLGCGITAQSHREREEDLLDNISVTLRALSDRKRLEVLRLLSKERSYCQELAETIGTDPGNMSRALAVLHGYGFLRQQREAQRNYYRADRKAVHQFFQDVEEMLFS